MEFLDAMTTGDVLGENLMPTHSTSGSYLMDYFFWIGGARGACPVDVVLKFTPAYNENRELALKALFHARDVRGGMGERQTFRIAARWLAFSHPEDVIENLHNIPHYGRWDDVLAVALRTPVEEEALDMIYDALLDGDKLAAKWMPREGKSLDDIAKTLMKHFDLSPRQYRKLLANNTEVVENLMCRNEWEEIEFSHVPSVAFKKYKKAFWRHQPERFDSFLEKAESGEETINASAIFPHDIISNAFSVQDRKAMNAQWNNLPDYGAQGGTLTVCDVSGSMTGLPMRVSVSLGIYFSERLEGPFKDIVCTFSSRPEFIKLPTGAGVVEKAEVVENGAWGLNTDLEAVFRLMLDQAEKHNLTPEKMPSNILILSDMQFDRCIESGGYTAMRMIREMYNEAGYEVPTVIFWNLRSSIGVPAKASESGVVLLSGFSPSLMESVMGEKVNPTAIMMNALNDERYDAVVT